MDRAALFVYGTLLFPEVQHALLGRVPRSTPGTATGWRVAALRDRTYPGLVAGKGTVDGLVLPDLRPDERQVIDDFEGDGYDLRPITLDGGDRAWTYVCQDHELVLPGDWDRHRFAAHHLPEFARRCAGWRDELAP